jgi:1,4-alpha-glucan branching enzyme
MAPGYLALVLHAHLPFVRHPEHESFLEESWLFEAITETYIPLIGVFEGLVRDGVPFRLTVSLSPTLVTMLRDQFLQRRYLAHLDKLCQLAESEVQRTRGDSRLGPMARFYRAFFGRTRGLFDHHYQRDLVAAFARLGRAGVLDLITTGATHGYLPLLRIEPSAVRAQLRVAADAHRRAFGTAAGGAWLPECGYYPGLEALVKEAGFRYFVVDTHGLLNASPRPRRGVSAPVACPNGVAAFGRDADSSQQVWSHEQGYPGDPLYREFYRDIGFDLDFDYVRPYILDGHTRIQTGIKYYRITGAGASQEP